MSVFKPKTQFCEIPTHETKDLSRSYVSLGHKKNSQGFTRFEKQSKRDEEYLMKNVCGEGYRNVLRDNERIEYLERFMFKVPKKTKMQMTTSSKKVGN